MKTTWHRIEKNLKITLKDRQNTLLKFVLLVVFRNTTYLCQFIGFQFEPIKILQNVLQKNVIFFLTSEGVLLFIFREQCVFLSLSAHRHFKNSFFGHLLFKDTKSRDMASIISTIKILLCLFCIYPGWTDQQWRLNILIFSYFGRITSYIHTLNPGPGHMQI